LIKNQLIESYLQRKHKMNAHAEFAANTATLSTYELHLGANLLFKAQALSMSPKLFFATPRKLPKPAELGQAVVILDIAFASNAGGSSFEKNTGKFITALGTRLRCWVDHHDSDEHARFRNDPRFVLHTKAEHGACPQIITPALVESVGLIDSIVAHTDFDGIASAAKWLRGGVEPYPGCDADAYAIDTRTGSASQLARQIDRSLKTQADPSWLWDIAHFLVGGAIDSNMLARINEGAEAALQLEAQAERIAERFRQVAPETVLVEVSTQDRAFDRTHLLLCGQKIARIAAVQSVDSLTFAAHFESGINFLQLFGLSGGMPTVVSIQPSKLAEALQAITQHFAQLEN
jgi:hypothetical protein